MVNGILLTSPSYEMAYSNPAWADMNDFSPLPGLKNSDRDLVIVLIWKNALGYGSPVDDPVFAAHNGSLVVGTARGTNETWYFSDSPSSALGCTQQYQFCLAREGKDDFCTNLTALPGKPTLDDYPGASDVQLAAVELLITSTLLFDISDAALDPLKATDLAGGTGYIMSLPEDQWIQEIAGWESFAWAALQTMIPDYAIGHSVREPTAAEYMRNETTNGEKELCRVQRAPMAGRFV